MEDGSRMDDVVSLTERLVKVDSYAREVENQSYEEVNGEVMKEVLDVAEDYLSSVDNLVERRFSCAGRESLVATFGDVKDVGLMLHGHLDVVSPDEDNYIGESEESHFEPVIETVEGEKRMYGRGTGDMKAGAACLMRVMKELSSESPNIGLMLTTDEEKGGFRGTKYLLEEEGYNVEFAISAEPDHNENGYLDIVNKEKGVLRVKLTANGESAHASKKWKGENAIEKLISLYWKEIKPIFPNAEESTWETTCNLGSIDGGEGLNKVPSKASIGLDIRWSDLKTAEEVEKKIKSSIQKFDDVNAEFVVKEPMLDTENNEYVENLQRVARNQVNDNQKGSVARIRNNYSASDARHFASFQIPAVVFGPKGLNLHKPNEYAVIGSFNDYIDSVKIFANNY